MPHDRLTETAIGNKHDSWLAWAIDHGSYCTCGCDNNATIIGSGEVRTVYLVNGVVYKVAIRNSANEYEHEMLTQWRHAGAVWAPSTTLHTWTDDFYGLHIVLAMPYLPDDGGDIDPSTLAAIRVAAPQTCRENYVSNGGRTWLIDGGDIEVSPS